MPFLRVDPNRPGAVDEARRSLDRGHRGIKLHPRAEGFTLAHPVVDRLTALAAERAAPLLIHAGRGMPALDRHPGTVVILAHCGISDLDALAGLLSGRPGIRFDTAWWNAADLGALFHWVDAGRILYASDAPYGWPALSFVRTVRAAAQAGARRRATIRRAGGEPGAGVGRLSSGRVGDGPPTAAGFATAAGFDLLERFDRRRAAGGRSCRDGRVGGPPTDLGRRTGSMRWERCAS